MTTTQHDLIRKMYQDGGARTYECGPDSCGYDGDTYCQNCGFCPDEDWRDDPRYNDEPIADADLFR